MTSVFDQLSVGERHSPAEIKAILHFYYSPEPYDGFLPVNKFVGAGILTFAEDTPAGYKLTEKGMAWVEMILSTPYPVSAWIDARTGSKVDA